MLNREHEVLTLSSKIQNDVSASMAKSQRDFFLREQLRAIQRELGQDTWQVGPDVGATLLGKHFIAYGFLQQWFKVGGDGAKTNQMRASSTTRTRSTADGR
jgi:hypothetical protein